jgi:hypothetical protein
MQPWHIAQAIEAVNLRGSDGFHIATEWHAECGRN